MKIQFQSDNKPLFFEQYPAIDKQSTSNTSIESTPDSRIYVQLNPDSKEMARRHPGELVMRNGWVHLDYDKEGFLIGIELVEGDPFTGVTECIQYLQPINPLIQ
jgi:hypothetical protein